MLGNATEIEPSTGKGHPTGRTNRWSLPSSYIMLIYEMFYYEWHDIILVWIPSRQGIAYFVIDD
jgi:hypothetical protein